MVKKTNNGKRKPDTISNFAIAKITPVMIEIIEPRIKLTDFSHLRISFPIEKITLVAKKAKKIKTPY